MNDDEREKLREYVHRWKETGEFLEKLRRAKIKNASLEEAILAFDSAFRSALWLSPNKPTSGLIEFHKILSKSR